MITEKVKQELKRYARHLSLVEDFAVNDIPAAWTEILQAGNPDALRAKVLALWKPYADRLSMTMDYISKHLQMAALVKGGDAFFLLYVFEYEDDLRLYAGGVPVIAHDKLQLLPEDLRAFYTGLHNGWTCAVSQALGPQALEDIQYLDAFEWGILDDINVKKLGIALDKAYSIFSNAGPGYLCLQNEGSYFRSFIWWTNQAPELNIDFWPVLDAWIEIGLTN
ncbi:hypothetical protein [Chitinophaga vietnamensis]|uniref:hypothetical protein n=1 Tax=Chitinophaga vietnamensis TaxID=2593957 RepID=UPI00117757B5|nr:hypothetical protein [Chitinophaga vietnamensis]